VVPVLATPDGGLRIGHTDEHGEVLEWAVHMRQFDSAREALTLLESGALDERAVHQFGRTLAEQHAGAASGTRGNDQAAPIRANFVTLGRLDNLAPWRATIDAIAQQAERDLQRNASLMASREADGFIRECHGDLHLGNLIMTDDGLRAFDCLEFDADLREIDLWCDVAFLHMDLAVRARADLAYVFVDGYLEGSADYTGAALLPMYARYRSVVRAKVAALKPEQPELVKRIRDHLEWTLAHQRRPVGRLTITCGLSGSGKSFWSAQLVARLPALRLRSDLMRKQLAGLERSATSGSPLAAGLYSSDATHSLFRALADNARALLARGEHVIVDAACLHAWQRDLLSAAAHGVGAVHRVVWFTAPPDVLRQRINARAAHGDDPSEADQAVLEWQQGVFEPPGSDAIVLDTRGLSIDALCAAIRS
jgi:aminoglycoside phosphotransferase family enzyme/predicted kinase